MTAWNWVETKNVAELLRQNRALGAQRRKVGVLLGAGCSVSAGIPLGSQWARQLCETYALRPTRNFMTAMQQIPELAADDLINRKVDEAKVNWTHLALARLLQDEIVDVVASLNFDTLVERACGLLGYSRLTVHDLANATIFDPFKMRYPALIYLHGKLGGFTKKVSAQDTKKHPLARQLFALGHEWIWVVIGYGGISDNFLPIFLGSSIQEPFWCSFQGEEPPPAAAKVSPRLIRIESSDEFLTELAASLGCKLPHLFWRQKELLNGMIAQVRPMKIADGFDAETFGKQRLEALSISVEEEAFHALALQAMVRAEITGTVDNHRKVIGGNDWLKSLTDSLLLSFTVRKVDEGIRELERDGGGNDGPTWLKDMIQIIALHEERLFDKERSQSSFEALRMKVQSKASLWREILEEATGQSPAAQSDPEISLPTDPDVTIPSILSEESSHALAS